MSSLKLDGCHFPCSASFKDGTNFFFSFLHFICNSLGPGPPNVGPVVKEHHKMWTFKFYAQLPPGKSIMAYGAHAQGQVGGSCAIHYVGPLYSLTVVNKIHHWCANPSASVSLQDQN